MRIAITGQLVTLLNDQESHLYVQPCHRRLNLAPHSRQALKRLFELRNAPSLPLLSKNRDLWLNKCISHMVLARRTAIES